jgi:DUF971 family protein
MCAKKNAIMELVADPKSVKVNKTTGTGMDIEWKDGHRSAYSFVFLRDACPCALCQEERGKDGRQPGDPLKPVAGALPMFKALARPTEVEPVGKYGIRFTWNDGHQHGIYSWQFLRENCPCQECKAQRLMGAVAKGSKPN